MRPYSILFLLLIMKNRYVSLLLIVLSLYAITLCDVCKSQSQRKVVNSLTEKNPLNRSPDDSIQAYSTQYSIQIKGQSNIVKVSGKVMKTTLDSLDAQKKSAFVSVEKAIQF